MATRQTPEETARELLKTVAREHGPGTGMLAHILRQQYGNTRSVDEFKAGLEFALDSNWFRCSDDGRMFLTLTQEGYEAA